MKKYLIIIGILFTLLSCEKNKIDQPLSDISQVNLTSEYLYDLMDDYYFWTEEMPSNPNLNKNPFILLEELRYEPLDKWSYIVSTEEYNAYYSQGVFTGYGFGYFPDSQGNIRVTFVFHDSPFATQHIARGWIIKAINGVDVNINSNMPQLLVGETHNFTFIDPNGVEKDHTFTKRVVEINTVLLDTVYNVGGKNIGYLVFKSFIQKSKYELIDAFGRMKDKNADELIVDLRYNGGGQVNIALLLGGLIGGEKVTDEVMIKYLHNKNHVDENNEENFVYHQYHLDLNRVVFITTRGSASASELLINGLQPYMETILIGDDTHGKPVGMYSWPFKDYTVVPISFKITNSQNKGDYFEGIPVNAFVDDDVTHNFGDTTELCLRESIYYLTNNEFSSNARPRSAKPEFEYAKGLRFEIGAY